MKTTEHNTNPISPVQKKSETPFFDPHSEQEMPFFSPIHTAIKNQIVQKQSAQVTSTDSPQHPTCYGRTLSEREIRQRLSIYQDLVREIEEVSARDNILSALCSFSVQQLTRMQEAGVRFWPNGPLPTHFDGYDYNRAGSSQYIPEFRIVRLSISSISGLRHELAHAWDHVRTMRRRIRLDGLSGDRLNSAILADYNLASDLSTRHRVRTEGSRRRRMSMEQMLEAYKNRMRGRPIEQAFGTLYAREGYSMSNVRDFYAEGYAVFHSGLDEQQARMRELAPELYDYLRQEAVQERMPLPVEAQQSMPASQ